MFIDSLIVNLFLQASYTHTEDKNTVHEYLDVPDNITLTAVNQHRGGIQATGIVMINTNIY